MFVGFSSFLIQKADDIVWDDECLDIWSTVRSLAIEEVSWWMMAPVNVWAAKMWARSKAQEQTKLALRIQNILHSRMQEANTADVQDEETSSSPLLSQCLSSEHIITT